LASQNAQGNLGLGFHGVHGGYQIRRALHCLIIDAEDEIAWPKAGPSCRPGRVHLRNAGSALLLVAILKVDTQPGTALVDITRHQLNGVLAPFTLNHYRDASSSDCAEEGGKSSLSGNRPSVDRQNAIARPEPGVCGSTARRYLAHDQVVLAFKSEPELALGPVFFAV
jgi:hypothetical protein